MAIYRGPGGTGDSTASASGDAAIASTAAANAAASAAAAAVSASSAGTDASTAQNAANNAANSETAAATSAGNAATSASAASASATAALASQTAAALSESNTTTLYDNFDDRYLGVKVTSPATDNDGNTLQTGALYFNSTTHDMFVWTGSLWTTVSNTTTSTNAATSAAAALASQTAAATSASNASTSASSASSSASTATTQATNAASSASSASTSATNAATSASNAATSETNATSSAILANDWATKTSGPVAGGEYSAKYNAQQAATSASNAATSASNASTSATNAANSASSAATSASNAAASYDAFDDRYLGAKSSAPTLDNDGNALLTGAIYWNTTGSALWIWDGSSWLPAAFSSAGNVTSFNTRTGAITLTSSDVTTALTYTPLAPSDIGSTVQGYDGDLQAIGAISGTSGLLKKTAANTWSLDTNSYLTSYTETDPIYVASSWYSTTNNSSNWNTAYGWGNHASAGYVPGTRTLTINGTTYDLSANRTWTIDALPSQTGNAGKYLTTNGTVASWATITANPALDDLSDVTITSPSSGQTITYNGTGWVNSTVTSNTTTKGLFEHSKTISVNYSITAGNNAMSTGPLTISTGISVTVPSGSRWVVL